MTAPTNEFPRETAGLPTPSLAVANEGDHEATTVHCHFAERDESRTMLRFEVTA